MKLHNVVCAHTYMHLGAGCQLLLCTASVSGIYIRTTIADCDWSVLCIIIVILVIACKQYITTDARTLSLKPYNCLPRVITVSVFPVHPVGLPQLLFGITVN